MIQVLNLTKRFGRTCAVRDVSFSIKRGEIVGFLGPNGAGKTTTMRILSCFLPPNRGIVTIAGLDIMKDSLEIRRRIGYLPEGVPLYPEMRVIEYLDYRARLRGMAGKNLKRRMAETLHLCGLEEVSKTVIGRLSRGYRQRVGLADSLVHDPELLILDEPTMGLDPNQIRHTRTLIKNLAERRTVLLSTHILSEVEMTCSRVLIMNKGSIVASDSPDRLVGLLRGDVHVAVETSAPVDEAMSVFRALPGVVSASMEQIGEWHRIRLDCRKEVDVRADVFAIAAGRGWPVRHLSLESESNLEDVFVKLTGAGTKGNG